MSTHHTGSPLHIDVTSLLLPPLLWGLMHSGESGHYHVNIPWLAHTAMHIMDTLRIPSANALSR